MRLPTSKPALKEFLDQKVLEYNRPEFIQDDPISIPRQFTKLQDIEIAGLFAATLAWGQRITTIKKCHQLMQLMDNSPHEFIVGHHERDLKRFLSFKHRTFNTTDTLYFIAALRHYYNQHRSLETAFCMAPDAENVGDGLVQFRRQFFSLSDYPKRTEKHVSSPAKNSACKRLNMYLRWMVRQDDAGVDFGLWKTIAPAQLICPCDVHVQRVAQKLKLITATGTPWQTAVELTRKLKKFDPQDPVKYDFALFGLGVLDYL